MDLLNQEIVWRPDPETVAQSNLGALLREQGLADFQTLCDKADADPEWWWQLVASRILFMKPYERVLDLSRGIEFPAWCVGGTTNITYNAIDRHKGTATWLEPAVIGESEDGEPRIWTYAELAAETSRLAAGMQAIGIQPGETIAVYMPNINEAIAGLLAITRIGAIAVPLFSGFGADAIASRLNASGAAALLTADGTWRRGKWSPMKETADAAADQAPSLRHVICLNRHSQPGKGHPRDLDWAALCDGRREDLPCAEMAAEAPALIIYTSGTTGSPKGTVHSHAGFAAKLSLDLGLMMDMKPSDRIVWFSDMGWLVGPILAYGATLVGASFVLAEGAPDYPRPTRIWDLIERHRASFLGVAPTIIRSFMGGAGTGGHDLSSVRLCVSTGEAWTPDAWWWTFDNVLGRRGPIINYTGGTEIGGGILSGTVLHPMKPCAFTCAVPGMGADIVDAQGKSVGPGIVGELVLRAPSIGLSRSLWKDDDRFLESYWRDFPGMWRQGDFAVRDEDGYWYLLGRSDDTLKIAGKRTGPAEIEALLTATGKVIEAAATGVADPIKGEAVACVVKLKDGIEDSPELRQQLISAVVTGLGQPYRPSIMLPVSDLPRTRNMKVMRRLVKAALAGESLGDTFSLVNPEAVDELVEKSRRLKRTG